MGYTPEEIQEASVRLTALTEKINTKQIDLLYKDSAGKTALDYAIIAGNVKVIKDLYASIHNLSWDNLKYAFKGNNAEIAEYLLSLVTINPAFLFDICDPGLKEILIRYAIRRFNDEISSLKQSDRIEAKKPSLYHYGAMIPFHAFTYYLQYIPTDKLDLLNIDSFDEDGRSAIETAIMTRNLEYLDYLIKAGANIHKVSNDHLGRTPLLSALQSGFLSGAKLLMEKGASLKDTDRLGRGALHLAILSGDLETVKFVLKNLNEIPMYDVYHRTPLHVLEDCQDDEIMQILLSDFSLRRYINEKDYFGYTPLDLANLKGNNDLIKQLGPTAKTGNPTPKYDINQAKILDKLKKFLQLTGEGDPNSMPEGHCNAFSFLFIYYHARGLKNEFFEILKLIAAWDGNADFLQQSTHVEHFTGKYKNVYDLFKQWANDLIWFQQSNLTEALKGVNPRQMARKMQYGVVRKADDEFDLTFRNFSYFIELFNKEQLSEILALLSRMPNLNIELGEGGHATSLWIMADGAFDYYDPNAPMEVMPFYSPSHFALHVEGTKYQMLRVGLVDGKMPLSIQYYTSDLRSQNTLPQITDKTSYMDYYQNSPNKLTPLHVAMLVNDEEAVKRFLAIPDIDLDLESAQHESALELAYRFGAQNIIKLIERKKTFLETFPPEALFRLFIPGAKQHLGVKEKDPGYLNRAFQIFFKEMSDGSPLSSERILGIYTKIQHKKMRFRSDNESINIPLILSINLSINGHSELIKKYKIEKTELSGKKIFSLLCDTKNAEKEVATILNHYDEALKSAEDENATIEIILEMVMGLARLQPFPEKDEDCMTFYTLLNLELIKQGLLPTLLDDPNQLVGFKISEMVQFVKRGQLRTKELMKAGKIQTPFICWFLKIPPYKEGKDYFPDDKEITDLTDLDRLQLWGMASKRPLALTNQTPDGFVLAAIFFEEFQQSGLEPSPMIEAYFKTYESNKTQFGKDLSSGNPNAFAQLEELIRSGCIHQLNDIFMRVPETLISELMKAKAQNHQDVFMTLQDVAINLLVNCYAGGNIRQAGALLDLIYKHDPDYCEKLLISTHNQLPPQLQKELQNIIQLLLAFRLNKQTIEKKILAIPAPSWWDPFDNSEREKMRFQMDLKAASEKKNKALHNFIVQQKSVPVDVMAPSHPHHPAK